MRTSFIHPARAALLIVSSMLASPAAVAAGAPRFEVQPSLLIDANRPPAIILDGLPPGSMVQVRAERIIHSGFLGGVRKRFRSAAEYRTDASGKLDLGRTAPLGGSYQGADLRGLFWSMAVADEAPHAHDKTGVVHLQAWAGAKLLTQIELQFASPGQAVKQEAIADFPGAVLATPAGAKGKLPVLILLGGGEGGAGAARDHAPRLAAQGFAVFGLPYYSPAAQPGGPRELPALPADFVNIDILQLNRVRDWLRKRSDIDAERIGIYGASKGAEFALLAASHLDWVKAVVAVSPSDVVWEGYGWDATPGTQASFAIGTKPLSFVPYQGFVEELMRFTQAKPVHLRRPHDQGRAANVTKVADARIPVERYKGALLLIAGQDDQLWNAAAMAQNIAERRAVAGLATELLVYSDAGHYLIGDGWSPTTHYNMDLKRSGGTPQATARAQIDAREKTAQFLRRAL